MSDTARLAEIAHYERAYMAPNYRLGDRRRAHIDAHLHRIPRGSLLDVSTGRGEVLEMARQIGHSPVQGTEAVDSLCDGETVLHALVDALTVSRQRLRYGDDVRCNGASAAGGY